MRLSIWQQWSSNHSSSLTLIGEFAERQHVEAAVRELAELLDEIREWHSEHYDEIDRAGAETGIIPLTEPEAEFAQRKGIDFGSKSLLYWGFALPLPFRMDVQEIMGLDRLVIMMPRAEAAMDDPRPLKALVQAYHPHQTIMDFESGAPIWIARCTITCEAPDETTAREIFDDASPYLTLANEFKFGTTAWGWGTDRAGTAYGDVIRQTTQLIFHVHFLQFHTGLSSLLDHLRARGCSKISYTLKEEDAWQER